MNEKMDKVAVRARPLLELPVKSDGTYRATLYLGDLELSRHLYN